MRTSYTVKIVEHPSSKQHKVAIVTTRRGYVFAATFAEMDEELTEEYVAKDYREHKKAYRPYDESRGVYIA
jgi:hypothetical protein